MAYFVYKIGAYSADFNQLLRSGPKTDLCHRMFLSGGLSYLNRYLILKVEENVNGCHTDCKLFRKRNMKLFINFSV